MKESSSIAINLLNQIQNASPVEKDITLKFQILFGLPAKVEKAVRFLGRAGVESTSCLHSFLFGNVIFGKATEKSQLRQHIL